jgi:hypothetical protein
MRKFVLLFSLLFVAIMTFGSVNLVRPPLKASEVLIQIGNTGKSISLMELSKIPLKDLEALTGRKMHLMDRLVFKAGQRKLKNVINTDGTFKKKRFEKFFQKRGGDNGGSGIAGFVLGYFLFLVGVLIAYLIDDDNKKNRVKWAWIGAASVLSLALLAIAVWSSAWGF